MLKGVKHDGDDGVFLSKKDQVKLDTVSNSFTINDIKKAVASREKTQAVGALFNAYMSVVEKRYPNLTLQMVSEGNFNAYYTNEQITINESVWSTLLVVVLK